MYKLVGLIVFVVVLVGCTQTRYVAVPLPAAGVPSHLQACSAHANRAQKDAFGSAFSVLQLRPQNLVITSTRQPVGKQPVSSIYDGEGVWFGPSEYRRVRFHCMFSPAGTVVYSFVRGEQ